MILIITIGVAAFLALIYPGYYLVWSMKQEIIHFNYFLNTLDIRQKESIRTSVLSLIDEYKSRDGIDLLDPVNVNKFFHMIRFRIRDALCCLYSVGVTPKVALQISAVKMPKSIDLVTPLF